MQDRSPSLPVRLTLIATAVVAAAVATFAHQTAWAQTLAKPADRITDAVIHADHVTFAAQQARIRTLNDSGQHRLASYSLAKAQCWLDASVHEYSRNDRSAFSQQALDESARITEFLESGTNPSDAGNPARDTPLVNGAAQLRPDLWERAARLKQHPGRVCAAQRLACAEVELVHAGNEQNQQQWRHATPYVQLAEDGLDAAEAASKTCLPLADATGGANAEASHR